ncbi:MAG: hypothetical protein WCH62_08720 [Candidatus Omnitrophota bacterium]
MKQVILRWNPAYDLVLHSESGNDFKVLLAQNEFVGNMSMIGDC